MMAARNREGNFNDRVARAISARHNDRPLYKIGDYVKPELPVVEGIWSVGGKTIVETSSTDPDVKLIEEDYAVTVADKAWFVVLVNPAVTSQERVRRYAGRFGFTAYWPRSIRLLRRGNGPRKNEVIRVRPVIHRYVLVHLPAPVLPKMIKGGPEIERRRTSPAFGLFTNHEAKFNGVSRFVDTAGHPLAVPDILVEGLVLRERKGEWDDTERKGKRRVSKLPDWIWLGSLVMLKDGPFASFPGIVEEIDEQNLRVKLAVSIFGRATPVDIDVADTAPMR